MDIGLDARRPGVVVAGRVTLGAVVLAGLAIVPLGILSTGVACVMMTTLVGRVGGTRGSVPIYLVPLVAIALGVAVRGETVAPIAAMGTARVLAGAWLTSRRQTRPQTPQR